MKKSALVYISPHGTTKKAMLELSKGMAENGIDSDIFDLKNYIKKNNMLELYGLIKNYQMLTLGTPTYSHHAVPVFEKFMKDLPAAQDGQLAVLLTTFGGVSSGSTLFEMAEILGDKGYPISGGIKVLAEHCLMFQGGNPIAAKKPDKNDSSIIFEFGKDISKKFIEEDRVYCSPLDFKNESATLNFLDSKFLNMKSLPFFLPNLKFKENLCTQCGICVETCPVGNISMEEYPEFSDKCIYCFSCVRNCPEGAIKARLRPSEPAIRGFARFFGRYEGLVTEISKKS